MNVAQATDIAQLDKDGFFPQDEREMGDPFEPGEGKDALGITLTGRWATEEEKQMMPPGFLVQTGLLFERELNNLRRDVVAVGARFGLTIFLSVLVGTIFWDVAGSDMSDRTNLQSAFGALIM
jgi:hypothetical protein